MILFIDNSPERAQTAAEIFNFMGIIALGKTPKDALSEISNRYRAVIISRPEAIADIEALIRNLRQLSLGAPIFALTADRATKMRYELFCLFDDTFYLSAPSTEIYASVIRHIEDRHLPLPGEYKLAGIDASATLDTVYFFNKPVKFTKTETMILRYLLRAYPLPVSAAEILAHAYKPGKAPEVSNVRTHVSIINKKFRNKTGRNLITRANGAQGYLIATPESAEVTDIRKTVLV